MAASNSQGTGAQNLANPSRSGCADVSGIALGPSLSKRLRASSLLSPSAETLGTVVVGGVGSSLDHSLCKRFIGGPLDLPHRETSFCQIEDLDVIWREQRAGCMIDSGTCYLIVDLRLQQVQVRLREP